MRAFVLFLLFAVPAAADDVKLKDGRTFTGILRAEGERVTVETGTGEFTFAAADVASIGKGRTPLHAYYEKDPKTARDHFELARWAEAQGIPKVVKKHLQRAVELDPEHEFARRALGYSLHKGRWMTEEEIRRDLGEVEFEGRWISKEERDLILAERASDRRIREMERELRTTTVVVEHVPVVRTIEPYFYDPLWRTPLYPYYTGGFGGIPAVPTFAPPSVPTWRFRGYTARER